MHRIESRFRFLAVNPAVRSAHILSFYTRGMRAVCQTMSHSTLQADSAATLRGYRPSYREVLLHVRDRLHVPCPGGLATQDLESEIFLHMLHQQAEEMQGQADDLQAAEAASKTLKRTKQKGQEGLGQRWAEMLASLRMGAPELLPTAVKLGSALSVQSLRQTTLRQLGQQLLTHRARYQAALRVVCRGTAPAVQRQAALQVRVLH